MARVNWGDDVKQRLPITLWSCSISDDPEHLERVCRVLRYCNRLFEFDRTVLLGFLPIPNFFQAAISRFWVKQIPMMDINQFNIFVNKVAPAMLMQTLLPSQFYMSVHEDGFILNPDNWDERFLKYDYIGAPWVDGVVGNGGFSIESRRLMIAKQALPFYEKLIEPFDGRFYLPSDVYLCRTHRAALQMDGIKFAPTLVGHAFSAEQLPAVTGEATSEPFGFHGRKCQPFLYQKGWRQIEESEK